VKESERERERNVQRQERECKVSGTNIKQKGRWFPIRLKNCKKNKESVGRDILFKVYSQEINVGIKMRRTKNKK